MLGLHSVTYKLKDADRNKLAIFKQNTKNISILLYLEKYLEE